MHHNTSTRAYLHLGGTPWSGTVARSHWECPSRWPGTPVALQDKHEAVEILLTSVSGWFCQKEQLTHFPILNKEYVEWDKNAEVEDVDVVLHSHLQGAANRRQGERESEREKETKRGKEGWRGRREEIRFKKRQHNTLTNYWSIENWILDCQNVALFVFRHLNFSTLVFKFQCIYFSNDHESVIREDKVLLVPQCGHFQHYSSKVDSCTQRKQSKNADNKSI